MVSTNKIIQMAKKWQNQTTIQRKPIQWRKTQETKTNKSYNSIWTKAEKGHFVVYSIDNRRFVLPLVYLENNIFRELFKLAEEEFGLSNKMPLMFPCDATVLKYIITLVQRNVAKDLEEAVMISITSRQYQVYVDIHQEQICQTLLCSF